MKIVALDTIPITAADKKKLLEFGNVQIFNDVPTKDALIERIQDAEIAIASFVDLPREIILQAPNLKYIIVASVGYDAVDVEAAREKGIKVLNCPTQNADAVANYTIALILAATRHLVEAHIALQQGHWDSLGYKGIELNNRALGIIGKGRIAKKVGQLAELFGMKAIYADSRTTSEALDEIIATSDILTMHIPHTKNTHHLLDARRLGLLKKSAYVINTARGGIMDQTALLQLLRDGKIAGAALDVFEGETYSEPLTKQTLELAQLPHVIATPHIAYDTEETDVRLAEELFKNIRSCLSGQPIHVVT